MCRGEGNTRWTRVAGTLLALTLLAPAGAAAQGEKEQEENQPAPEDQAATATEQKPKVFTNADLAKYGKSKPAKPAAAAEPPAEGFPEPVPAEAPPAPKLAPEDRPDDATVPELQERERELAAQLAYLKAKLSWLRNPLLPRPTPPEGETLLDPDLSGGEEFRRTQSLLNETENRLFTTRATLGALGVAASPEE